MKPKYVETIAVCLAGAAVISASAQAKSDLPAGNPYAIIIMRNVFGLQPLAPPAPPAPATTPLPKIMLKGTMSIFGSREALFSVVKPASPEHSASDKSYMLKEGELQDGIEVRQVNEKAGVAIFANHGTIQEIKLWEPQDDLAVNGPPMPLHHPF
jgi:hypothetical protein